MKKKNNKNTLYGTLLSLATFTIPFNNGVRAIQIRESVEGIGSDKIENGSIILGITKFTPESTVANDNIDTAKDNENKFKGSSSSNIYYYFAGNWYNISTLNKPTVVSDKTELAVLNNAEVYYVDNIEKTLTIPYQMDLKDGYDLKFVTDDNTKDSKILFANNTLTVPATIKTLDIYLTNASTGSETLIDSFSKQRGEDETVELRSVEKKEGTIAWDGITGKTNSTTASIIKNAIYFDGTIGWYVLEDDNDYGNFVGVVVTAPTNTTNYDEIEVTIDGDLYTWGTLADGNNNYFKYNFKVTDTVRSHKIVVDWDQNNSQEFTVDFLETAELAEAETRTITFETNGGELANPIVAVPYGTKYDELPEPNKLGHEFAGWYLDEDLMEGTEVTEIEVTDNITLYAAYTKNDHVITFDNNVHAVINTKYGDIVDLPENVEVDGYRFLGWYVKDNDGNNVDVTTITVDGDITVYAKLIKQVTVTFKNNETDEEALATATIDVNTKVSGDIVVPALKEDYNFAGWTLDGTTLYNFDTEITEDITLFALYTPKDTYTIIYDGNGGLVVGADLTQIVTVGKKEKLRDNVFTRDGYAFMGWSTTDGESAPIEFRENAEIEDLAEAGEEITLYAVWLKGSYNITYTNSDDFDMAPGAILPTSYTVTDNIEIVAEPVYKEEGYSFVGWTGTDLEVPTKVLSIPAGSTGARSYTANFAKTIFTITIENGSDDDGRVIPVEYGDVFVKPADPIKDGYTFTKWVDEDGNDFDFDEEIKANHTITAVFTANTYTVNYNANGGVGTMDSQSFTYDEDAKALSKSLFTKENYNFYGWSLVKDGDRVYTDEQEVRNITTDANGVVTLYAVWQSKAKVYVEFDDGTNTNTVQITKNEKVTKPADPIKDGHKFLGWFAPEATVSFDFDNTKISENITLTAKWEKKTYAVTFTDYTNHNLVEGLTKLYEETVSASELPVLEDTADYKFAGWALNGTKLDETNLPLTVTGPVFLSALWTERLTVTFNTDNGEDDTIVEVLSGDKVTEPTFTPEKAGWSFSKWVDEDGNEFNFNTEITSSITIKAEYTKENYTITYNSNIDGVSFDGYTTSFDVETPTFTVAAPTTPAGYVFKGWSGTGITGLTLDPIEIAVNSTGSRTYTANFNKLATATYKNEDGTDYLVNGESQNETIEVTNNNKFATPTAPSKLGYTFAGWYSDLTNEETKYNFDNEATDSVTLYAKFNKNKYNVIYHSNTEGNFTETQENVEYDTETTLRKNTFTKDEFKFVGWATTATGTAVYTDEQVINSTAETNLSTKDDVNLYAVWTEISRYVVTFDTLGGTSVAPQIVKEGTKAVAPASNPEKGGYTFAGWYADSELQTPYDFDTTINSDGTVIYAKWTKDTYNITLNTLGGTLSSTSITREFDSLYGTLPTPEYTGKKFVGWFTDSELNNKIEETTKVAANTTEIFAKYVDAVTVTYKNGTSTLYVESIEKGSVPENKQLEGTAGTKFVGWYKNSELTQEYYFDPTYDVDGEDQPLTNSNLVLFARFDETPFEIDGEKSSLTDVLNKVMYYGDKAKIVNIKLIDNKTVTQPINIMGNIIVNIDLNGKTLTADATNAIVVNNGSTLYISDTVGTGKVIADNGYKAIVNNGTVTLYGGEYTKAPNAWSDYVIVNHGRMTIKSGVKVNNTNSSFYASNTTSYPSLIENGYYDYANEYELMASISLGMTGIQNPTLTIDGGVFDGGLNTVKNDEAGKLTINGGTFKNTIQVTVMNWNETTINGGTFNVPAGSDKTTIANAYKNDTVGTGKLTINGGTFKGEYVIKPFGENAIPTAAKITGGVFENTMGILNTTNGIEMNVNITGGTFNTLVTDEHVTTPGATVNPGTVTIVTPNE